MKRWTKQQASEWLEKYAPHIILLQWGGAGRALSKFLDKNRNIKFVFTFEYVKGTLIKKPNIIFSASKKEIKEKIENTNLEKYGVKYSLSSPQTRSKIKKTNLEKYGTEYSLSSLETREKIKETCHKKYGGPSPSSSEEIKNKIKKTCIKKYGKENPSQSEEVKNKIKQTNLKKYGIENSLSFNREKYKEKYGYDNPSYDKDILKKREKTRIKNGNTFLIEEKTLKEIAKEKNIAYSTASDIYRKYGKDVLLTHKKHISKIENKVKLFLLEEGLIEGKDFICNKKLIELPNKKYKCPDFYLLKYNLIIECDGDFYHCNPSKYDKDFYQPVKRMTAQQIWKEDKIRDKLYIDNNFILLKFWGHEIKDLWEEVKQKILIILSEDE